MQVIDIDHVALRVSDLDRAADFYALLGCTMERRAANGSMIQLRAGASLIDLISEDAEAGSGCQRTNVDHVCLRIAGFEVEAARQHLLANGVEVGPVAERYGSSGNAASLYLKDRDGNKIELRA